eukprot:TRINITY_DN399_c0_g1_i4.p1 TRINITY_DN399_c0_g1~~TRINITY_DN399_c0_g1_i4.p1  ORF type:complete len:1932 (+),score=442.82 TRINITY_DN399_c0_g1_i4:211-6006(+)
MENSAVNAQNPAGEEAEAEPQGQAPPEKDEEEQTAEDELCGKAQQLMETIVSSSSRSSPNPRLLHALACLLEKEESRFLQEYGPSFSVNARSSHSIGRLGNLLRGNDDFFELLTLKFLTDTRYSTAVRAAAARLLLACAVTWVYPHVFEEAVLDNIEKWATEDVIRPLAEECNSKGETTGQEVSEQEMLKTYATGLLSLALNGNSPVVEEVLTSGLAAKLMRFLRVRVIGESITSQKEANLVSEGKQAGGSSSVRVREDGKGRLRHVTDVSRLDFSKMPDETTTEEQNAEKDPQKGIINSKYTEECFEDADNLRRAKDSLNLPEESSGKQVIDDDNAEYITEEKRRKKEWREVKSKLGGTKSLREEEPEESGREDPSRRQLDRAAPRHRGKTKISEGGEDLPSPVTGPRWAGRTDKEKATGKVELSDSQKRQGDKINGISECICDKLENDATYKDIKIGTKDISEMVKKAQRAAEAEARAANAPVEAVKAAGDAAAELVKSAAAEVLTRNGNEEEAVTAASTAMHAVVDAALSTEVSRGIPKETDEWIDTNDDGNEKEDGLEENLVPDPESLGRLREQYSIQCLERLGEYVEVLGPVLHEKGVDVCLALLQRESKSHKDFFMLSDLLKLICALAAHRKFAALFVDRGGVQKLLALPRVPQTFIGISMCLFAIASLQGIMERVCALPTDTVHAVVELALFLLECSLDQARRNAALFFGVAFVFRAVLDAFDAKDGLQTMLDLLKGAATIRSGGSGGTTGTSNGSLNRNDRGGVEVLTATEKQIAYHTCVAMRQYFRAHLLMLVDILRPNKSHRSGVRAASGARAAYKPIDISNEAIDSVFAQLQHDRKLAPAFVRARWPAVDKFLSSNGHTILLELSQAPPGERYLHDLALYALGVLQIVTLVPYARKLVVGATLSNDRSGTAVILEAASGATYGDPEVICAALLVLVNLVCPPPSLCSKTTVASKNATERATSLLSLNDLKEPNEDQNGNGDRSGTSVSTNPPASISSPAVVGDRRISLGPGAGCAGLAAFMEQCYRQAREAVRANNGIRVLLHLLHPRTPLNPSNLDCIRALSCRVLLGLAKDDTIAQILTKLQVGKLLSELVRDSGSQIGGAAGEQSKWQSELSQVAMELIAIVTNAGRASTLAATDAAAPTLRRIERAAIAAATPITYHSRELLLLIHEHLLNVGLKHSAAELLKEAQLTPLSSLGTSNPQRTILQEPSGSQLPWPSGRVAGGFMSDTSNTTAGEEETVNKNALVNSTKKKALGLSLSFSSNAKTQQTVQSSGNGNSFKNANSKQSGCLKPQDQFNTPAAKYSGDVLDLSAKTPSTFSCKRKASERDSLLPLPPLKRPALADSGSLSPSLVTPISRKSNNFGESDAAPITPGTLMRERVGDISCSPHVGQSVPSQPSIFADSQSGNCERATLDSLVVQYLKHQHRQCPAPITTLPPLSLLHPHVCPEPSRALEAPINTAGRLMARQFRTNYGRMHGHRRDRQFVFSRFRPWRTCRDDAALLTSVAFLGNSSRIATGSHAGEIKIFDTSSGNLLESHVAHPSAITMVQCTSRERGSFGNSGSQLVLTSCNYDVRLWDSSALASGPVQTFENCRAARFSHSGGMFAAISTDPSHREILLYDVQSCNLEQRLSDNPSFSSGSFRGSAQSLVHFSPSDTMLLWNGVLWDHRISRPVHRFDQFTDYGGGGFHPAGNEVIINSEVWDLRKFKLLRSVPSLDQTVITFNATGDIIYATLRRNLEDIMSALHHRRTRHPLYAAFRTMDAVHYSDIALTVVDRCVLDLATEPTDSLIGLVAMDDSEEMDSSARIYEVGRRRPTDDDSDPDDGLESDEEDDVDSEADEDAGEDGIEVDGDSDMEISSDEVDSADDGDDGDFDSNDDDDGVQGQILEIISDGEGSQGMDSFSSDEDGSMGEFDEEFLII